MSLVALSPLIHVSGRVGSRQATPLGTVATIWSDTTTVGRAPDGGLEPESLVLAYPVAHDPVPRGSAEHQAAMAKMPGALRFSAGSTVFANRNYLGDNAPDVPYAFPALGRLDGLPRSLILICQYDDLRATGEGLAEAMAAAGVPVTVELVEGVTHGHLNVPGLPAALRSLAGMAEFFEAG